MKTKQFIVGGLLAVLVIGCVVVGFQRWRTRAEWERTVEALRRLPLDRVATAIEAFARDRKPTGESVPLQELISGGYLRTEDIQGLEGQEATVALPVDEATPQRIWIRVRVSDGSPISVLGDGSIKRLAE
jgi:hypothetical protein